jgi:hypothetical protein
MKTLTVLLASVLIFMLVGCATTPQPKQRPSGDTTPRLQQRPSGDTTPRLQQRPSGDTKVSIDMEVPFELLKPERQKEAQELGYKPGEKVRIFKPEDGDIRIVPKK